MSNTKKRKKEKLTFKASNGLMGCIAFPCTSSRKVVLSDTSKSVSDSITFWSVSDNCNNTFHFEQAEKSFVLM